MQEVIKKINAIKYKIRALIVEKQEIVESYGLTSKGFNLGIKCGQKVSPQEAMTFKIDGIDDKIHLLEEQLDEARMELRTQLEKVLDNYDDCLIYEQRMILNKQWHEIQTLKDWSESSIKRRFYSAKERIDEICKTEQ